MEALFIKLFNMSMTAGWLIIMVLLFRFVFKRAPKWVNYILWGMVAVRLICPVSIESVLSLIPRQESVFQDVIYDAQPELPGGSSGSGIDNPNDQMSYPVSPAAVEVVSENPVNPVQIVTSIGANVWVAGMILLAVYAWISYLSLYKKVKEAVWLKENMWQCDHIETAFILGVIRPTIYIPSSLEKEQIHYVAAHEKAHIKQKDHWWKPFGFLLLMVYWFNPLIWMAYIALCKDIELACDERVIKDMNVEEKKAYSTVLLECSISERLISACPVAFGEVDVEGRVKSVLNYKKPKFWISGIAVLICIVLGVGFLTNPAKEGIIEPNICGSYVFEVRGRYGDDEIYLTLGEDQVFTFEEFLDPGYKDEYRITGTYEQQDDMIILQKNEEESCRLHIEGGELVFENAEVVNDSLSMLRGLKVDAGSSDRFIRMSSAKLKNQGCEQYVIDVLDNAAKDMLIETGWTTPVTIHEFYFDKDWNCTTFNHMEGIVYREEEEILEDSVLKVSVLKSTESMSDENFSYSGNVKFIYIYEWLQTPNTLGTDYQMTLSWTSDNYSMVGESFRKIDKYVMDGTEYIYSAENSYTSSGTNEISWYTDLKGTLGEKPERLYGCAVIELSPNGKSDSGSMMLQAEYQVGDDTAYIPMEYQWYKTKLYTVSEE